MASRMGILPRSRFRRARWGFRLAGQPLLATRKLLIDTLSEEVVIRPGSEGVHTHPSLPGVEFSAKECLEAADLAISAQKAMMLHGLCSEDVYQIPAIRELLADDGFRAAARASDAASMMSLSLKQMLIEKRLRQLPAGGNGLVEKRQHASVYVEEALALVQEFRSAGKSPEKLTPDAQKMLNLSRKNVNASEYELAMLALDARRQGERLTDPNIRIDVSGRVVTDQFMREHLHNKTIFDSFTGVEKDLIAKILGIEELKATDLPAFLSMHPGKRELLLQRGINRQWLSRSWKDGLTLYSQVRKSMYAKCDITEPTIAEKREAASDPANLSKQQLRFVSKIFPVSLEEGITGDHIEAFRIWLEADPQKLQKAWDSMYSYIKELASSMRSRMDVEMYFTADTPSGEIKLEELMRGEPQLNENLARLERTLNDHESTKGLWLKTPKEERMQAWRYGSSDLFAAASLANKLRFGGRRAKFTEEEDRITAVICPGLDSAGSLHAAEREILTDNTFRRYAGEDGLAYTHDVLRLVGDTDMDAASLRTAAYLEAEFRTLAGFLGIRYPSPATQLVDGVWSTRTKEPRRGVQAYNEDSCSSVELVMEDGRVVRLDMVADGMGGHKDGSENLGETNGQAASRIAKEVFEVCAMAGWITSPEDARRTIIMADLAILAEQVRRKTRNDSAIENNMGCTMSIMLQIDSQLWGVHCGDSDWKAIRDGDAAFLSIGHTSEWGYLRKLGKHVHDEMRKTIWEKGEMDPYEVPDSALEAFLAKVDEETHRRFAEAMEKGLVRRSGVACALGHGARYIHINNKEHGYQPFEVKEGDLLVLCSDGAGVPICNHEFSIFAEQAGGDLAVARENIVDAASKRVGKLDGKVVAHSALCNCQVPGKPASDDITLMMRYGNGALKRLDTGKSAAPEPEEAFQPGEESAAPPLPSGHEDGTRDPPSASATEQDQEAFTKKPRPSADYRPQSIFRSQTDAQGRLLPDDSTRYLDRIVREVEGSEVVQEVAGELGIFPRDLEIMLFHAYCDDLAIAKEPHHSPDGWELTGMIPTHLLTKDAEHILNAAYLIYILKDEDIPLAQEDRDKLFKELQVRISSMEPNQEYTQRLQMGAFSIQGPAGPGEEGSTGRKRGGKA